MTVDNTFWGRRPGTGGPAHGAEKMHRLLCASALLLAGCQGVVGPAQRRCLVDPIDDRRLPTSEQQQRARDRLALPESSPAFGPRTYADNPALRGP
jgi:hypothetical protein